MKTIIFWIGYVLIYVVQTYLFIKYRFHILGILLTLFIDKMLKKEREEDFDEEYKPLVEGEDYDLPC